MKQWGIRHQVLLLALVPTLIIALLLGGYFISTRLEDLEQHFCERGKVIALKFASVSEEGVFTKKNKAVLRNLAQATLKEQGVTSVGFYSLEGLEIATSGQQPVTPFKIPASTDISVQKGDASLTVIVPVTTYQEDDLSKTEVLMGWLRLEFDNTSILLRKYQVLINTGLILILGLGISVLFALQMGRKVTQPLMELAQAVKRIREGNFKTRIRPSHYPELQVLEADMNTMAEALQNAQAELQHKIDQATASLRRSLETIELQNLELELSRQAAEAASQIKSEFLANMSHEIRTPLNSVVGFINLLQKTELDETQTKYLNTLKKSSTILLSIINDILDFSKIEAGKLCIEPTLIHIRECIEDALSVLTPQANEKSLSLIPLFYSDVPTEALGDPLRIKQVITNLANNAIKFTEKGSIIVRVKLEKKNQNHALIRVSVTDTGTGLSPSEQQELFQAFNQIKTGTSHKFGGTGLGLVISKKLVEQMKGKIGLESEQGKGSTFWFTFEVETLGPTKKVNHPSQNSENSRNPTPTHFTRAMRILAVDDNPENLQLIATLLQDLGVSVTIASSGQEAFETIKNTSIRFNLILMDIRMPHMNGIETTHAIRNFEIQQKLMPTPIIALTAHAFISEREQLLAAGIDDCLTKPIDETILQKLIQKWTADPIQLKSIDWNLAVKLASGKQDLARELLHKLIETLPDDQSKCQQAFLTRDWEKLRDVVHRLHGACCYCGVPKLKYATGKLETALATRNLSNIQLQMDMLNQAIGELLRESVQA